VAETGALELVVDLPPTVLAIYAHPDDAEVSCGGSLASWAKAGSAVHLVLCSIGDKGSRKQGVDPARLVKLRAAEVEEAAQILGLRSCSSLGYRDGEVENDSGLRGELVGAIRRLRPNAIVTPDPTAVFSGDRYYNHRDHRVVGFAALDAAAPAAASPLYYPDRGAAHEVGVLYLSGSLAPDVAIDISAEVETKCLAVLAHRSQLGGDEPSWSSAALADRAARVGRRAGVASAEAFRRIRLLS